MPTVQLGVYRLKGPTVLKACQTAFSPSPSSSSSLLYSGLDTASIYGNEGQVGQVVKSVLHGNNNSKITREDLFIQTKLWRSHQGTDPKTKKSRVPGALNKSLRALGLTYVDLWLLHWPGPGRYLNSPPVRVRKPGEAIIPIEGNEKKMVPEDWSPAMRLETWSAMCKEMAAGRARAVGVCNMTERQLRELIAFAEKEGIAKPAVVQNECHPLLPATNVRQLCNDHGIVFQAFASLGSESLALVNHEVVKSVAKNVDKTPAQVLLRWAVQKGCSVLPRSSNPSRIIENAPENIEGWTLPDDEMERLDALEDKAAKGQTTMASWFREYDPEVY